MNTHRFVVISMLATGGLHSAFATDASATDAAADRPFWVLQGGLQIDDKDSYMDLVDKIKFVNLCNDLKSEHRVIVKSGV